MIVNGRGFEGCCCFFFKWKLHRNVRVFKIWSALKSEIPRNWTTIYGSMWRGKYVDDTWTETSLHSNLINNCMFTFIFWYLKGNFVYMWRIKATNFYWSGLYIIYSVRTISSWYCVFCCFFFFFKAITWISISRFLIFMI